MSAPFRRRSQAATRRLLPILLLLAAWPAGAGASEETGPSLNLMIHETGIAFGHAPRVNGIRINLQDRYLERVNGLNLTLWSPPGRGDVGGDVNGFAVGLVAPTAARLNGVQAGLAAVVASERLAGVSVGGLAVVSEGERYGISVAGLASVSERNAAGVGVAGLAVVSEGRLTGLHAAGLATVAEGDLVGIHFGGLAAVSEGGMRGIGIGGLAVVSEGTLSGIAVGGLAAAGERGLSGIGVAGLAVVSDAETRGIAVALGATGENDLRGLGVATYNRYRGVQRGLTIGVFNWASELRGVQIGLLNRADNNPPALRWLPLLNASF